MKGWTTSWPKSKQRKEGRKNEQDDAEDRGRPARGGDEEVCGVTRSAVPGTYGAEADPEMDAGTGRVDDAGVRQRSETGWEDSLRVDTRKRRRILFDRRVCGAEAAQQDCARGADVFAGSDAG